MPTLDGIGKPGMQTICLGSAPNGLGQLKGSALDLAGQAVIFTGSSSGISAAIARRLSGLGAGIIVNSASSAQAGLLSLALMI